jgi:hypothetical protein
VSRGWAALAGAALAATLVAAGCGDDDDDGGGGEQAEVGTTAGGARAEPTVIDGAGDIGPPLDEFRALLGPDNGGVPERRDTGRRELNWDAVPDELAEPNALPPDFFNAPDEPRARGALLETPGDRVAVSADGDNPAGAAVRFGDLNPTYADTFRAFSEERLFSPVGSNVVDLRFAVPGTDTPAAVRGFGAVYTDVDAEESASFEFFDAEDESLGTFSVPVSESGLSFLGIAFPDPDVARIRIVYGNSELGPDDGPEYDVAVMDDFIYGEPQPLRSGG